MSEQMLDIAFGFLVILTIIMAVLYLFPGLVLGKKQPRKEGFTTVALNKTTFPACLARDYEAQGLLQDMYAATRGLPPAADGAMAYQEFALIVQKLLCMDADITSLGAGDYSTMLLPFNTQHDMEPVGSFVGRCLKNAVRERDISITLGKLQDRGNALIDILCGQGMAAKAKARTTFDGIVQRTKKQISAVCLKPHDSMDIPAGVRDPGYYVPPALHQLSEYQNTAPKYHF